MLCYPHYDFPFLMFLDSSDMQLGTHASQIEASNVDFANFDEVLKHNHYPVLLHSQKLNDYQTNCLVTNKELLIVAETLA